MSFNTKPIHIQTNLCIHLCVLTSGPPQWPLCAPTVTGPEVKTEKKPENLGFYASSTILKGSKYDFTIDKLYPSALVNSITTQNGRPLKTKTIFVQRKNKNSTNYCFILFIYSCIAFWCV
jgi:hypothetical protein